ncbi:DUF1049 domain-containing protein [Porphyrobacter sp. GA68]|uniref:DUF1049 domain-containing protein n=1 Tax=Porphyrobacter sp. GA68 TaxID=2883480 RepID=UPI001D188B04|nr:DUF1049 domain-containing protein [Porphyrobacter sp. GA68]
MLVLRTAIWVLIFIGLFLFSWANWQPGISVRIWSNMVVDTRLPAVVAISFLLGFVPMWLVHRGAIWRWQRRVRHLESLQPPITSAPAPAGMTASTSVEPELHP